MLFTLECPQDNRFPLIVVKGDPPRAARRQSKFCRLQTQPNKRSVNGNFIVSCCEKFALRGADSSSLILPTGSTSATKRRAEDTFPVYFQATARHPARVPANAYQEPTTQESGAVRHNQKLPWLHRDRTPCHLGPQVECKDAGERVQANNPCRPRGFFLFLVYLWVDILKFKRN